MAATIKSYHFEKGTDAALDQEFADAVRYSKIKPGKTVLFWKAGLRWYHIPFSRIQRIYRQVQGVYRRLCCGGNSFLIERLVLVLQDDSTLVLHIGDDVSKEAEALFQALQDTHPELKYGKV